MQRNQSAIDRAIRAGFGLGLVAIVFFGPSTAWLSIVGLVLLMTGLFGFCPLYHVVGVRTCRVRS